MKKVDNPYIALPPERYWRTGVGSVADSNLGYPNFWTSKFPINIDTKIITVGSCFAQHISGWIKENGFTWVEAEPAPDLTSRIENEENGYGVFSFRVGNIYSPALLRQWVDQALGKSSFITEVGFEKDHFFDPFRPLIPVGGFKTPFDCIKAREYSLECIKKAIVESDLLIFTLGLTEAWENVSGYVYPVCPGTIKGQFDPDRHRFINYSFQRIYEDLRATFASISAVNPKINFLLTVSPVPLTATASKNHILIATTYSKSLLRAAAGALAEDFLNVDYFPSYELIAQFTQKGRFYDKNLRSIRRDGVDFVMQHFERGIGIDCMPMVNLSGKNLPKPLLDENSISRLDTYCDELFLEDNNQANELELSNENVSVLLVGDSHMNSGRIGVALKEQGVQSIGGTTMRGHIWAAGGFELDDEEIFVPLDGPLSRRRWLAVYRAIKQDSTKPQYLVTNIGMHTNINVPLLYKWVIDQRLSTVSAEDVRKFFLKINSKHIKLMQSFIKKGLKCIVVSDPPTQKINPSFEPLIPWVALYEDTACQIYTSIGCYAINVRSHFSKSIPLNFYSPNKLGEHADWIHGSLDYYRAISSLITEKISEIDNKISINNH